MKTRIFKFHFFLELSVNKTANSPHIETIFHGSMPGFAV